MTVTIFLSVVSASLISGPVFAQDQAESQGFTVTLLGTGTPFASIERFGPSTLIEVGGQRLVFDSGRGITIRLTQLGIRLPDVTAVFLTHLHSDHVNGLSDLWLTGWIGPIGGQRTAPFEVYGPVGTEEMATHLMEAYAADVRIRSNGRPPPGAAIDAHDITQGLVYEREGVRVTAFDVEHVEPSLGYRVDYQGHSVVLSGDTRFSRNLIDYAEGTDVLIHEVIILPEELAESGEIREVINKHTGPEDAGRVFSETKTRLAVYNHIVGYEDDPQTGEGELVRRTRETYAGPLEIGSDLMSITVGDVPRVSRR
jgi:ribonuclease Z